MRGTVIFFKRTYGFIVSEDLDKDIYFDFHDIVSDSKFKALSIGDIVDFSIAEQGGKKRAVNVTKIGNEYESIADNVKIEVKKSPMKLVSKFPIALHDDCATYENNYALSEYIISISKELEATKLFGICEDIIKYTKMNLPKGINFELSTGINVKFL